MAKQHWVIIMKPMGDEILVHATRDEVNGLRPRAMVTFPLADLLAGGWALADIQTPDQVRAVARRISGPCFEPIESKPMATWMNECGQLVSAPM